MAEHSVSETAVLALFSLRVALDWWWTDFTTHDKHIDCHFRNCLNV